MAIRIPVYTKNYPVSETATIIDGLCSYGMAIEVLFVICMFGMFGPDEWITAIFIFLVLLAGKLFLAPRVAEYVFEKKKEEAESVRQDLMFTHIMPVKFDNGLIIRCPKCGNNVNVNKKCSCGCDIWKNDLWFRAEIDEIYKRNNMEKY